MDVVVPGTNLALGDDLRRRNGECGGIVRGDSPQWSDGGEWIALSASPESVGRSDRLDAPWTVYVMNVAVGKLEKVVDGVRHASSVAISPDGNRLSFSGTWSGQDGVFVVERQSGTVTRIDPTPAYATAFSPSGAMLAGAQSPPDPTVRGTDVAVWSVDGN